MIRKAFPALLRGFLLLFCSSVAVAQTPVLTQAYDSSRDGLNSTETILTPANVNSTSFGKLLSFPVDGKVYAQPLYVPNVAIAGQSTTRNVIFVATMHDSVYAFDADGLSVQPYWHASFINPSAGVNTEPVSDNGGNTDTDGEIGVMGTPVIDSSTGTLYVIAKTDETSGKTTTQCFRLHALDITTGAERTGSPTGCVQTSVPGTGIPNQSGSVLFSSLYTLQRPGLALNGNDVYAAFGSWGDAPPWHGWVLAFDKSTLQIVATFNATPNGSEGEGGVWESGRGLAVDSSGYLFLPTGNGNFDGATNFGDSYIKLNPNLTLKDYFTPYNQQYLDNGDLDIASAGITLLPDSAGTTSHPHIMIGCGKNDAIYVIDRDNLGQFNSSNDNQIIQEIYNAIGGISVQPKSSTYVENCYSGAAYWNGNVYFGGIGDSVKQFTFTNGLLSTSAVSHGPEIYQFPGGFPVISANGTSNGILWAIDNYGTTDPGRAGTAVLRAYDATNLATELYNSNQSTSDTAGADVKFTVPTVTNGKVYVGTQSSVAVYGLLSSMAQAAAPVYNPPGGSYSGATTISISDSSPGTSIYYTTDGSTPTTSSALYSGPFLLSNSATLSAIAVGGGYRTSPVSVATYSIGGTVPINFAQVAAATPQGTTATVSVSYPAAESPGDMNIVVVGWNDTTSTVQSVTDSAGNTYKLAIGPTSGTALQQSIYYAANVAGVSDTVTVTFNQAATAPDIRILEYRGVTTLDVTAGASGSGPTASSGAATTSGTNELIFGANTVSTGNAAAGSGFTARIITQPDSDLAEDQVASTAGSFSATATLTSSGYWVMQMAAFSAVSGPTPTVTGVSPSSGPVAGGTSVTITGTNFASGATVTFGSTPATGVTVVNSTTITATSPAGSAGAVAVTVTVNGQSGSLASGFTYIGSPTVTSVSPNSGPISGGTSVTITGTNFASGATVTFGSTAATGVTVVNSTTITATTPAGSVGAATVTVTNPGSQSGSLASGFTYIGQPTVTGVSPNSGSNQGGTAVTISGTNFASGATVTFGSTAATNVTVVNSTTITATTPAGSVGAVTVTVTNVGSQSGSLASGFTYVVAPSVTGVSPNSGPVAGGTSVTITGTNFASGATVTFGSTAATGVTVVNSTTITATTPAGTAGAVTVTVTVNGQSGSLASAFTYIGQPTVTSVSPSSGSTAGGTAVTITGTNFASGATVTFGAAAATSVTVVNSTTITAKTPAGSAGTVTVTVTNVGAQNGSLANGFTYVAAPTVTGVSPNSGPVAGGTSVTISGTNFATGATVTFGAAAATGVTVVNSTTITATTPAGSAGAVTVTVTVSGQSGSLANGFTYVAPPTVASISPNNGPTAGGTSVTITGTNFASGATVTFGAAAATNVVVVNSTTITAATPAGSAGAATVTVTVGGQSGSLSNGFTYNPPVSIGFAQVGSSDPQSPSTTVSTSFPAAETTGDMNIVVVGWNDTTATVQSVTDSAGNTYKLAIGPTSGTALRQSIYYAANVAGVSDTVTVTFSQAAVYPDVRVLEYRGVNTLDVTAGASGSGTAASSGSATTTIANELIFGANTVATGNKAAGTGFTSRIITRPDSDLAEDKTVTTAGSNSATATLTSSGAWVMQMATFASVTGPPPTVTGVSPNSGTTAGGTSVTITGTNFAAGATVTFGSAAATGVTVANSTTITATTPAGSAGTASVSVTVGGQSGSLAGGFTYVAPPTVTNVSPNNGSVAGGTAVTITGTNFASGATVSFGSAAATGVTVVNSTTITATTPAGTAGAVTVTVTNTNGLTGSLSGGFTYTAPPTVTGVSPSSGALAGGTSVTITGTNFASGATVTFGSAAATGVTVVNSTTITATTPAGTAGAVTVTVTVNGQSGSLTNGFTYAAAPTVSSVSPNSGPIAGGTSVTITGTNFASGATVTFGSAAATGVTVVNSTTITATTPAGTAGAVTVTVTVNGQSGSLTSGFTYAAAPTVTGVSPSSGALAGGTSVTITGTNFASGATVTFGSAAATGVTVVNSTTITATTPAGTAGAVTVTVTVNGQSGSLTNGFTYAAAPTVSSVSPSSGPIAGGTSVTITGANFASGATVTFGSAAATGVTVVNSTTITATTPAGTAGAVTVTVTVNGQSGSLTNGFTYAAAPTVTGVSPSSGALAGGTSVTITGTNFASGATVTFGSAAATGVTVVNSTTITATTPAGTAGAVTVTVTVNGQSGSLTNGFTYAAAPTVTGVSPSSGPIAGGTSVTITGANFASGAAVTFGSAAATGVTVVNSTTITATAPAGSVGAVTVTVTVNGQSGSLPNGFTYVGPPTVTGVSPSSGSNLGGTSVTITGTNFASGATVTFGSAAATNVTVVNSTTITATTPAGSVGAVTVTVTNVGSQSGSLPSGFTYVVAPSVTGVSPNSGPLVGGTSVTITGTNFASGATVTFGSAAATGVTVVNSSTITATTPAGAAGSVTVTVTVSGQSGSLAGGFTYMAPPTVTGVSPSSGVTTGGTSVTITGTNFATGATVTFGSTAATGVTVVNSTTITATTPAGAAGTVTVTVTVSGQSGSLASGFTYVAAPTVTSISPNSGPTTGGTAVTITGTNFVSGATVTFGSTAATGVTVVNGSTITATTPAAAAGSVTVTVTVSGQSGSLASGFTYVAKPTVTGLSPSTGPTAGGTSVTITGTNFASGATVNFGSAAATGVTVVNSTTITATTPAGAAGAVTVTVTVSGQSGSLASGFTYVAPPTVTGVSPSSGPTTGGTSVTITGTNFVSGATVTFGSAAATGVTVVNSTTITATTPAGSAGAVTVTVTVSGQSGSLPNGFTYVLKPTVTAVSPNNGPTAGGTAVTITGTNFASGATVTFGSAAATAVTVVNSTTITATTPAGSAGAVMVTVTVSGQSGSLASGFTYNAPVPISFSQVAASTPQSPTSTVTVKYPAAEIAGDMNIVVVGWNDTTATVQSVTDSAGNTYKLAIGPTSGTALRQSIYYAANVAGVSDTVTVTFSQAAVYPDVRVLEYRGVNTLDVTAGASGSGTAASSGSATTTIANELIFGANTVATGNLSAGSGFTSRIITNPDSDLAEDKTVTTAGSNSATATLYSGAWVMQMATFASVTGPAPTVTSVSPNSGTTAGGTSVTITGTNFAAGATVTFGSAAATGVTVVNGTTITATTPAGSAGAAAVTVTVAGQSGSLAGGFTYVAAPTVASVSPNSGTTAGGTAVTITGTNFASGATVTFGGAAATGVTVVNSTTITATTPAGGVGAVTVTVTNSNGLGGSLAGGFTYAGVPTVTGVSPNSGSNLGGTAVTITGTNFAPGATVTFGSAAATGVTVVSSTTITATTPAGNAGAVTVTVTNVGSQSGSLASGFTYTQTTSVTPPGNFAAALSSTSTPVYVSGQQYYNSTAQTTHTSSAFNSTGADLLLIFLGCHNQTSFAITDSYGNTWLPLVGPSSALGTQTYPLEGAIFYAPNAKTGSNHTITVTLSQSEPLIMSIAAISGDNTYSPIDAYSPISSDNDTQSSYIYSGPLTTYQMNDLLFGVVKGSQGETFIPGAGFVNQSASTGLNFGAETGAASTSGAYTTNFTASTQAYWQSVLTAIAPTPNQTTMSWTAAVGGPITNYYVERCAGVGCSTFTQIASLAGTALSYTDTSISAGTTYSYRVRAENSAAMFSAYSTVQTVSPIVPRIVSSLTASTLKSLSWNASAETGGSISQYSIERCAGTGCSNFSPIATTVSTSYTDASGVAGTTYSYRVRAQDANSLFGPYSEVASADIPAYLDNASDGGNNGGSTASLSYSFTVGVNSNRLLVVSVVGDTSVDDLTSVTYGGASLTLVKKIQTPSGRWHYLYSLLSPSSGTNNVVITAASSHYLMSEASSWFNIAQSNQPQASATNTAAATAEVLTATLPASSNNAIVVESMWAPNEVLPGNGSTEILADASSQSLGMFSSAVSPVTSGYPVSMTNTWGGEQAASSITASFLLASNGTAGISYDNAADGGNNGGSTTSLTYSYTVGTGSNRLLIVNVVGSASVDDISSVKYAGTPMTLLGKVQPASNSWEYVYYLLNPASGTNNVVITAASAHSLVSQAASWYNVNQSSQPDALVTNSAAAATTSMTTTLIVNTPGSLVVQGVWSSAHLLAGQGATPVVVDSASDSSGIFVGAGSPVTTAGPASMTTISDGTLSSGVIMASFAP